MAIYKNKNKSFTLIELLVVIAIIGLLSSIVLVSMGGTRAKARDTKRLQEIQQIVIALELFYNENNRYPDNSNDGVSNSGECIGDGVACGNSNAFENAIREFLPSSPKDPSHNCPDSSSNCSGYSYFYAYDPTHNGCEPVVSFYRFENVGMQAEHGRRDTTSGGDMQISTAQYVICLSQ